MNNIFKVKSGSSKKKKLSTQQAQNLHLYTDMRKARESVVNGEYFRNIWNMYISK